MANEDILLWRTSEIRTGEKRGEMLLRRLVSMFIVLEIDDVESDWFPFANDIREFSDKYSPERIK